MPIIIFQPTPPLAFPTIPVAPPVPPRVLCIVLMPMHALLHPPSCQMQPRVISLPHQTQVLRVLTPLVPTLVMYHTPPRNRPSPQLPRHSARSLLPPFPSLSIVKSPVPIPIFRPLPFPAFTLPSYPHPLPKPLPFPSRLFYLFLHLSLLFSFCPSLKEISFPVFLAGLHGSQLFSRLFCQKPLSPYHLSIFLAGF